ncbi:hypothetical protein C0R09_01350 [Brevibacillus laterosporus]|uniref:hypothetical protein n=1 Tax=Brevibacillus laterosporus TaxID=1465 RepID=UPI000C75E238|nr:hypothetical protein [Brevibacillus laterosporus]AUM63304.1 hypothetical protein C0R09_01350 [Brevibacillus laterosporus]
MPSINAFRIAGLCYNKFQKRYDDFLFDLSGDNEYQHTLISMINGGGKGALLQAIFQVVMPGTTWGENSKNHVSHYFFNESGTFIPYTFHIAMEWKLEGDDPNFLLTGVVMTAEKKMEHHSGDNQKETTHKIVPKFRLYVKEYHKPSDFQLSDLPFTAWGDATTIMPFSEIVEFLKEKDVYVFSNKEQYWSELRTYNIFAEEWNVMRNINRLEGGVVDYFKDCLTNKELFNKKIIPSISQNLNLIPEFKKTDDLLELFRSQAKIAEDLPVLLKREGSYRDLLRVLEPYILVVEEGTRFTKEAEQIQEEGKTILSALQHLTEQTELQKDQYQKEANLIKELVDKLRFRKANLPYAKAQHEINKFEEQLKILNLKLDKARNILESLEEELEKANLHILIKQHETLILRIQSIQIQVEDIQQNSRFKDVQVKLDQVKSNIEAEWENLHKRIHDTIATYKFYRDDLRKQMDSNKKRKNVLVYEITKLSAQLINEEEQENKYQKGFYEAIQQYSEDLRFRPNQLLIQFQKKQKELGSKEQLLETNIKNLQQKHAETKERIGETSSDLKHAKSEVTLKLDTYQAQIFRELTLGKQIANLLREDVAEITPQWLRESQSRLQIERTHIQNRLNRVRHEYYALMEDQALADSPYWIPNQDILDVKEQIEEQGVPVHLGTHFLAELSEEIRIEEQKRHPSLPYGLLLLEKDWKKLRLEPIQKLILHSLVPIFIREEMAVQQAYPFKVIQEQGTQLALDSEYWESWRNELRERIERQRNVVVSCEKHLEDINKAQNELENLILVPMSESIEKEYEYARECANQLEDDLNKLNQEATGFEKEELMIRLEWEECKTKGEKVTKTVEEVINWIAQMNEHNRRVLRINEFNETKDSMVEQVSELERNYDGLNKLFTLEYERYQEWYQKVRIELSAVQKDISNVLIPEEDHIEPVEGEVVFNQNCTNSLLLQHASFLRLSGEQEKLSIELVKLRTELSGLNQSLKKLMPKLEKYPNWQQVAVPLHNEEELERIHINFKQRVSEHKEILQEFFKEEHALKASISLTMKHAKELFENLKEDFKEFPFYPSTLESVDLEEEESSVSRELKEKQQDYQLALEFVRDSEEKVKDLQAEMKNLRGHLDIVMSLPIAEVAIIEMIKGSFKDVVSDWIGRNRKMKIKKDNHREKIGRLYTQTKNQIESAQWESILKEAVYQAFLEMIPDDYEGTRVTLGSIVETANHDLLNLQEDKEKAEEAQRYWSERASMKVVAIVEQLKSMVKRMKYRNKADFDFHLVKLDKDHNLPTQSETIMAPLKNYFTNKLKEILDEFQTIDDKNPALNERLRKMMSDEQIVYTALGGNYPILKVYNIQTSNALMYDSPKNMYYSPWETINQGDETEATGSGGQKLSARMIVMMMLLSFRNMITHQKVKKVLISDNPFSNAVSQHVLDPIFAVAEILNYQWIVFAPPELIKMDVSRRFPTYYALSFEKDLKRNYERVVSTNRVYH